MSNIPTISEALRAIDILEDFVDAVQQLSEQLVGVQSVTKKPLVPTRKLCGMDVIIDNDMPDDRVDFLLDDVIYSSIRFDDDVPNLHIGMDGRLKDRG